MELIPCTQIRQLIPKKSVYYTHEKSHWASEYDTQLAWFQDGDFDFTDPLNLDNVNEIFRAGADSHFPLFILIKGNARLGNIFNAETDGSTGLVVLGNLTADNIVVGGQEIFVQGDLQVKDLYWGDYNHGSLQVHGDIKVKVFINTDYGVDDERFQKRERMTIEHLLDDDQEESYTDGEWLQAFFPEEFLMPANEIEFPVYSWKDWLREWKILEALQQPKPVLLNEWKPEFFPKEETAPPFFDSEEINEKNLLRFGESLFLQPILDDGVDAFQFEFWKGDDFRRVYRQKTNPLTTMVYLQHDDDFACMVYMGVKKTLFGKSEHICTRAYRNLPDETWLALNASSPEKYRHYLNSHWKALMDEYTQMNYWWDRFQTTVTAEKINTILSLPLIQEQHSDYYADDSALWFGAFQWDFRLKENSKNYCPRITIVKQEDDDRYDFYLFDIEDGSVILRTQYDDGYEADIYDVLPDNYQKIKNAVLHFEKLDRHIYTLNDDYVKQKDIDVDRFILMKGAFAGLITLCLSDPHLSMVDAYLQDIEEDDCNGDLLDKVRLFCEDEDIPFLISLDWKAENMDFYWFLFKILMAEFGFEEAELQRLFPTPEDETTALDATMKESDKILRKHGLQLGFANDCSDQYIFFVHRIEAAGIVRGVLEITDYDYQEARDL